MGRRGLCGGAGLLWLCCWLCRGRGALGLQVTILPETLETIFVLPLYDIGLAPGAVVSFNVTNALPSSEMLLVVLSHHQWSQWLAEQLTPLPADSYSSYLVSNWRQPLGSRIVARYRIRAPKHDRYYIGVLNVQRQAMLLGGTVAYENPGGQHLPLQLAHLPETLWASCAAFVLLMLAAVLLLSSVWQREATMLHALLVGCFWLKSASLALKWKYFAILSRDGRAPLWRLQVCEMTEKLQEVSEIFLLLITALGWRVLRPRLTHLEVRFAALTIGLASALAALQVGSDTTLAEPPVSFRLLFYVVRVMCYLVIIFAMNFNLQLIAVHLAESPVTPAIAVLYRKQQAYIGLRRLFLAIVFRPSALLWLRMSVLDQEGTEWVVDALREASAWLIYTGLFVTLRPGMAQCRLLRLVRTVTAGDTAAEAGAGGTAMLVNATPPSAPEVMPPGAAAAVVAPEEIARGGGRGGRRLRAAAAGAEGYLGAPYVRLPGGD